MSCEQWQYAVSAGWLGMTDTAPARLGYVALWKLAVSRRPKRTGRPAWEEQPGRPAVENEHATRKRIGGVGPGRTPHLASRRSTAAARLWLAPHSHTQSKPCTSAALCQGTQR